MMKFLREVESDKVLRFVLSTSLLLILLSFLLPLPIVLFVQDLLYFSRDHIYFFRPELAFSGMSFGMIVIALSMLSFIGTKMLAEKADKPYRWTIPHVIVFLLGLFLCAQAIDHYYYLTEDGVTENKFFLFGEEYVPFYEVEAVHREVAESNYAVLAFTFTTKDKTVTVPYDSSDPNASRAFYYLIHKYEWDVEDNFIEGK